MALDKLAQGNLTIKKWYKDHFDIPLLNKAVKFSLRFAVDALAKIKGMEFPKKYDWDWKLEMLLQKYEKETTALVKKFIKPGMIAIDAGAHIGYYSRLFSKLVGKEGMVYSFEPEESNFELLKKNTKKFKNIKIIKSVVSDRDGFIDFYRAKNNTGCHSILASEIRREKVILPSITLDNFIKNEGIRKIDFIKLDIEGGEPFALSGAKNLVMSQQSLGIIMEFTPSNFDLSSIPPLEFLKNLKNIGFSIFKIKEGGEIQPLNYPASDMKELMAGKESTNLFLKK